MTSDVAAMLGPENDQKSFQMESSRVRSLSESSGYLLNRPGGSDGRQSSAFDSGSAQGLGHNRGSGSGGYHTPTTPAGGSAFSQPLGANRLSAATSASRGPGAIVGLKQAEAADPYYRPPRRGRTSTNLDNMSPISRSPGSWATSGDWGKRTPSFAYRESPNDDAGEGPSSVDRGTPVPAHLGAHKNDSDPNVNELARTKTDYAVREVDYYYGVRGPALKSSGGTRKLKTGPADPTGTVSSATGWFKGLMGGIGGVGGKTKDKGKGFEVVRSARAPPPGLMPPPPPERIREPYRDEPDEPAELSRGIDKEADIAEMPPSARELPADTGSGDLDSDEGNSSDDRGRRVSQYPPSLPVIDTGGGIELPSRMGSKASKVSKHSVRRPPSIPRKSSRRQSSGSPGYPDGGPRLSTVAASPPTSPKKPQRLYNPDDAARHLQPSFSLPFVSEPSPSPTKSNRLSTGADSITSSINRSMDDENRNASRSQHGRHSSSALGTLAPDIRNDRPSSMGYVQQHRASDNIHTTSPDSPEVNLLASTAEVIESSSRGPSPRSN